MERLLTDPEPAVRDGALRALEVIDDGDTKLMALFAVADREGLGRGDLDAHRAIAALNESGFGAAHEPLVTHLIRAAVDAQPATIGVIADLLIASKHGDPLAVGTAIDLVRDTGTTETDFSAKLQPLRIEVGGATALDPLLRAAQQDLDTYFRRPLDALNASTETTWRETLGYAQRGFKYRTRMSLIVFGVGVLLLLVAAIAFFTGKKSGNELWGPGIAFGGGLASILLTVYSGPLKDIRQSVTDLAAANAAYIGYVHSVLQVSHTFSRRYLSQDPGQSRLTFKEISESTALIEKATRAAVEALRDIREAAPTQGGSESTGPTSASARGRGGRAARGSAKNSQGKSRS
jgi:hypothetical protein